MGVIRFRISGEDEGVLRRAGVDPAALAKEHVEREARRRAVDQLMVDLEEFRARSSKPVEEIVREIRDEH